MGIISSRLNFDGLGNGRGAGGGATSGNGGGGGGGGRRRRRSQPDETLYSYSLNKNYFSNYFLMNGERFDVNDPDYLFGEICDLNFLSCTKPHHFPYKQAQQNLLTNLTNSKQQKAINKTSSQVISRFNSPFNHLIGRGGGRGRRRASQPPTDTNNGRGGGNDASLENSRKQDAQTQTLNSSEGYGKNGSESPMAQPLVMFVNIRKETLRLVKTSNVCNLDSDHNSLTNYPATNSNMSPLGSQRRKNNEQNVNTFRLIKNRRHPSSSSKHSKASLTQQQNRLSASSSRATTSTVYQSEVTHHMYNNVDHDDDGHLGESHLKDDESEESSLLSATSSTRSGYASVREDGANSATIIINNRTNKNISESSDSDDENFVDALNDTTNFSQSYEADDIEKIQPQSRSSSSKDATNITTKETSDIKITIEPLNDISATSNSSDINNESVLQADDTNKVVVAVKCQGDESLADYSIARSRMNAKNIEPSTSKSKARLTKTDETSLSSKPSAQETGRVYNIEFYFDAEVDCSIRIFYFCTREITSTGINYKPQHATYKSKIYNCKKGLNQKFDQQEHTFQPYLFDEDLLIYKPLDMEGNYNSGAVFPIVIHIVALDGSIPRQSQSLVATIEKSQLDNSYSIKPLKQLIFVDGVQYILQDIYGIEHKQLLSGTSSSSLTMGSTTNNITYNATKNMTSVECVICMSDERDTILLPCRHLCICGSCAMQIRQKISSCPICRCPFKAALSLHLEQES